MTSSKNKPLLPIPENLTAPVAERRPLSLRHHGEQWQDDYAWLRDSEWQQVLQDPELLSADIRHYLEQENDYCDRILEPTLVLQQQLVAEMRGRECDDDSEPPEVDGPFEYFWRHTAGSEHPRFVRTVRGGGEQQVLLDAEQEASNRTFFELGDCEVSPDHTLLAWSFDDSGAEQYQLHIRDLASGKDSSMVIAQVDTLCWINNNVLLYVLCDEFQRASRLYRHVLGSDPADDELITREADQRFSIAVGRLRCGTAIEIVHETDDQSEVWLIDCDQPMMQPRLVCQRRPGHEYCLDAHFDRLFILTNSADATDFRLVTAPLAEPAEENWQELIPHQAGRLLLEHHVFAEFLVLVCRQHALPRVYSLPLQAPAVTPPMDEQGAAGRQGMIEPAQALIDLSSDAAEISFGDSAYALALQPSPEFDNSVLRLIFASPTTPDTWYDIELKTGERSVIKRQQIPSGHCADDYRVQRLLVKADDGADIPLTLLHHRLTPLDGSAACLLYGYGAYGSSVASDFSSDVLSLVDRGIIYAMAHVRGGQENGRDWYLQSKQLGKNSSFNDFIDCAHYLGNAEGGNALVDAARIVAVGRSAGGLLVGASVNMRPDLFAAVVAEVPFVDVLNTMLDADLPLTPGEWEQWGNPIDDVDAFKMIRSYSPYDQVQKAAYPAMLVTGALADPRVAYWEPAKWLANLRHNNVGDQPLMLRTIMSAGHAGISGRYAALADTALVQAFICAVTGQQQIIDENQA